MLWLLLVFGSDVLMLSRVSKMLSREQENFWAEIVEISRGVNWLCKTRGRSMDG